LVERSKKIPARHRITRYIQELIHETKEASANSADLFCRNP